MSFPFLQNFRDPELCKRILDRLHASVDAPFRFMEVCGTHTVAIFQSGLRSLLPENIIHLSGPGCPVCVTHEAEVNAFLDLAGKDRVRIVTFGDLMRVPGNGGRNLKNATSEGARVSVVYSPMDALKIAAEHPDEEVVFLGVGFETTAPTVAATVLMAEARGLTNFSVLSFHKLVPPALESLLSDATVAIDAFVLPGHVSAIIGLPPYAPIVEKYRKSGAVTGFEPVDILESLLFLVEHWKAGMPEVANLYRRVVAQEGNPMAMAVMNRVFVHCDALWRGMGNIPDSGLELALEFERFDAKKRFDIVITETPPLPGCRCGDVLKGVIRPNQCPLFRKVCTPAKPVGPCMVSTEGSCAAYYKYSID